MFSPSVARNNYAEVLLLQNERGDPALAATIADWMSVRFSDGRL
jgi:hypothetical protein